MTTTIRKTSLIRRLLEKLYPPHEEIAIYTTAVGLVALAFTSPGFRDSLSFIAVAMLAELPAEEFQVSPFKGVVLFFGGMIFLVVSLFSLAMSLYLPFTRRRFDLLVELMIMAHVILIFASNALFFHKQQDVLSLFLVVASFFYMLIFFVGYRWGFMNIVISDHHASARQGVIAAVSVAILVTVLSLGFNMHWAHCYALATAYAVGMAKVFAGTNT